MNTTDQGFRFTYKFCDCDPNPQKRCKSKNDSSNYRSIAIGNIIGKILDKIILSQHSEVLSTNPLQFGFKRQHSTVHCTFALCEFIELYTDQNSWCYVILLDPLKAFDRAHYVRLFMFLCKRRMCPSIIKLLIFMYTNLSLCVRWQDVTSPRFSCTNGIKQGGVLSPILFCVHMDEVLKRLERLSVGCMVNGRFAGALCYADMI
jgi:hypothetical protein